MVFVNSQTEKLFGYAASELVGQRVRLLVPGQLRHDHQVVGATIRSRPTSVRWAPHWSSAASGRTALKSLWTSASVRFREWTGDRWSSPPFATSPELKRTSGCTGRPSPPPARPGTGDSPSRRIAAPKRCLRSNGMRFAWAFEPSERLAGDSFNVFNVDDDHVALYLLDVSGHGGRGRAPGRRPDASCRRGPGRHPCSIRSCLPTEVAAELKWRFQISPETWLSCCVHARHARRPHRREPSLPSARHPGRSTSLSTANQSPSMRQDFPSDCFQTPLVTSTACCSCPATACSFTPTARPMPLTPTAPTSAGSGWPRRGRPAGICHSRPHSRRS